jgi:hypothetical protein
VAVFGDPMAPAIELQLCAQGKFAFLEGHTGAAAAAGCCCGLGRACGCVTGWQRACRRFMPLSCLKTQLAHALGPSATQPRCAAWT